MVKTKCIIVIGFVLWNSSLLAQNADDTFKKQRIDIQKSLRQIQLDYNAGRGISKNAMNEIANLNRQVEGQERYLISMAQQQKISNADIGNNDKELTYLKKQIATLRDYYYTENDKTEKGGSSSGYAINSNTSMQNQVPQRTTTYQASNTNNASFTNGDFSLFHGQLPYPGDKYVISQGFGKYKINGMGPNVFGDNPGVTFAAPVNSPVKAVFEGEVVSVSSIGGMGYIVLRHGKYITAYSNLATASITKGSKVTAGQVIGTVGADDETGYGKLDFILMVDNKNIDPRSWFAAH